MRTPDPARVVRLLATHRPGEGEREMAASLPGFARLFDLVMGWDGSPASLDHAAFTHGAIDRAVRDLLDHREAEAVTGVQRGNLTANVVAARSLAVCLLDLPRAAREVGYL